MKILFSILFTIALSIPAFTQVSNWRTLTNMSSVRSVAVSAEGIWAATSGGAFFFNLAENSYKSFSKSEGLSGASLTAAATDKYGKIWFGSSNGTIDIYDPANNSFTAILDIFNSDKTTKQINEIRAAGDTIFIATDFGISLVDAKSFLFYDTYFRFGNLSSNIKVYSMLISNIVYACTDFGIAIQKAGSVNLSAPESWNVYSTTEGMPSNKVNRVINFGGNIIAATDKGLSLFDGNSWSPYLTDFNTLNILDIASNGETLFILLPGNLYSVSGGSSSNIYQEQNLLKIYYSAQTGLLASGTNGIRKINEDATAETIVPNGPQVNQFSELSIDQNSTLWSASGRDQTGAGFYKYENEFWTNYNMATYPELPTNFYHTVYTSPDNIKYFGSWGQGFAKVKDNKVDVFTLANTDLQGTFNDPNFLVITHFGTDSKNNLWVLNYDAVDKNTLSMLTPDSSWYHFNIPSENNLNIGQHFFLAVDQYDTKWFASLDTKRMGLYYFNENKTFDNSSDDKAGFINSSAGLNENTVTAIAIDRRGDIWVGTSLGVNIISNINSIVSQSSPQIKISPSVFTLRQQTINCIAVDPLNQKWVGTNQGLLLVNSDGSALLASYNSKNSPLLDDVIRSIAIDENTGRIYVGTDAGLTSFETPSVKPEESFSELFIFPSPFVLKRTANNLTIDGLIRDTDIKILSSSGKLINQFTSPGGRTAFWNGTDEDGNLVNSGIYFIVAYDKEGNNVSTGKIAVLKE